MHCFYNIFPGQVSLLQMPHYIYYLLANIHILKLLHHLLSLFNDALSYVAFHRQLFFFVTSASQSGFMIGINDELCLKQAQFAFECGWCHTWMCMVAIKRLHYLFSLLSFTIFILLWRHLPVNQKEMYDNPQFLSSNSCLVCV